ncbi:MAG: LysR family transcriptional regulator [Rhizobiaceae bacterium]
MKIQELELFMEIARLGSFAKVAKRHAVDPSSVSRQVSNLESELGYRLFERTTRRLSLTEAGQMTFDRIQAPLEQLGQVFAEAKDILVLPSGLLRITTSVAFGERWLSRRLASFQAAYPEIELDIVLSDRNIDLVSENVDVAIRLGERMAGTYVTSRLLETRYHVVASPRYLAEHTILKKPEHLADHNCLTFSLPGYRSIWRFRTRSIKPIEVQISGTVSMTNALGLRRAALDGIGVALLSDWTIEEDLKAATLIDVFPHWLASATSFETAAWLLYPSKAYVPTKTRAFIDHIKSNI